MTLKSKIVIRSCDFVLWLISLVRTPVWCIYTTIGKFDSIVSNVKFWHLMILPYLDENGDMMTERKYNPYIELYGEE